MTKKTNNLLGMVAGLALGASTNSYAGHKDIIIVSGQSNARAQYAQGIFDRIESSERFSEPILYHVNHSGNRLDKWIAGSSGNYSLRENFLNDFWNPDENSGLQQVIQNIENNGDSWNISGFFWFQGEGDSGSATQRNLYWGRYHYMLNRIEAEFNLNHDIPFVVTAIDYNGDDVALANAGRTPQDIEEMREVHFQIGESVPYGATYDSRGWPRLDLWHVGDLGDPRGRYAPVGDLGREEAEVFLNLPVPANRADLNGDGINDLTDINLFINYFMNNDPRGDLAPPADVYDLQDLQAFINYW